MPSYDFEFFIASCFPKGPIEGKDGLDFDAWYRLSESEKQKAIEILMDRLYEFLEGQQIQERVIEAIGTLKVANALPILKELIKSDLTKTQSFLRAQIGLAIHRISGYPEGIDLAVIALEHPYDNTSWWEFIGTSYLSVFAQGYKRAVRYLLEYMSSNNHNLSRASTNRLRELFKNHPAIMKDLAVVQKSLVLQNENNPIHVFRRKLAIKKVVAKVEEEIGRGNRWK